MKKAKVLLTALVVFAAVGTTLAFKARSTDQIFVDGPDADNLADAAITGSILVPSGTSGATPTVATSALNLPVVSTFQFVTNN